MTRLQHTHTTCRAWPSGGGETVASPAPRAACFSPRVVRLFMSVSDFRSSRTAGEVEENTLIGLAPAVQQEISKLLARLRRRQVNGSIDVARKTLEIMRMLVATSTVKDVRTLILLIKRAGAAMVAAQPHELVIGNMVRRVLATVREETADDGSKPRFVVFSLFSPNFACEKGFLLVLKWRWLHIDCQATASD